MDVKLLTAAITGTYSLSQPLFPYQIPIFGPKSPLMVLLRPVAVSLFLIIFGKTQKRPIILLDFFALKY